MYNKNATRGSQGTDEAPCGACRSWIFFINGVLYFLKINGSRMEKEDDWRRHFKEDESRRSSPP
ncbi:hypothetical protein GmHk_09G026194 [Glycine max]|nr:hypothetical protein GmHk_09G026194 [Glycine max]